MGGEIGVWRGRASPIVDIREDNAWLLQSRINPLPAPGALSLTDGRISFCLASEAEPEALEWLAPLMGAPDLRARLGSGEPVVVFDHALTDCVVTWPITGGGSVMNVRTPARKWVVSYDEPVAAGITSPLTMFSGRHRARAWKRALADSR